MSCDREDVFSDAIFSVKPVRNYFQVLPGFFMSSWLCSFVFDS